MCKNVKYSVVKECQNSDITPQRKKKLTKKLKNYQKIFFFRIFWIFYEFKVIEIIYGVEFDGFVLKKWKKSKNCWKIQKLEISKKKYEKLKKNLEN